MKIDSIVFCRFPLSPKEIRLIIQRQKECIWMQFKVLNRTFFQISWNMEQLLNRGSFGLFHLFVSHSMTLSKNVNILYRNEKLWTEKLHNLLYNLFHSLFIFFFALAANSMKKLSWISLGTHVKIFVYLHCAIWLSYIGFRKLRQKLSLYLILVRRFRTCYLPIYF